jgi:hypothetical protein
MYGVTELDFNGQGGTGSKKCPLVAIVPTQGGRTVSGDLYLARFTPLTAKAIAGLNGKNKTAAYVVPEGAEVSMALIDEQFPSGTYTTPHLVVNGLDVGMLDYDTLIAAREYEGQGLFDISLVGRVEDVSTTKLQEKPASYGEPDQPMLRFGGKKYIEKRLERRINGNVPVEVKREILREIGDPSNGLIGIYKFSTGSGGPASPDPHMTLDELLSYVSDSSHLTVTLSPGDDAHDYILVKARLFHAEKVHLAEYQAPLNEQTYDSFMTVLEKALIGTNVGRAVSQDRMLVAPAEE